jgi:hypothetical protein
VSSALFREKHLPLGGKERTMSNALETVVEAYVRSKSRTVLEEMRMHRHRLKVQLQLLGEERGYDVNSAIGSLKDDLAVIEAGI